MPTGDTGGARNLLDGPALVLRETLSSGVYETRLYRYDGVIMEEYALADAPYDPAKATAHRAVVGLRFLLRGRIADHYHRRRSGLGGPARGGR